MFSHAGGPKRDATITVLRKTAFSVHVGGRIPEHAVDRCVFLLCTLRACIDRLLAMSDLRLGNRFLQQKSGIPIGGPVSGVVLETCCNWLEYMFDWTTWRSIATTYGLKGHRSQFIAAGRYAEDTIFLSPWFCNECLSQISFLVYQPEISFEESTEFFAFENSQFIRVVDFWLSVSFSSIQVAPVSKNEKAFLEK